METDNQIAHIFSSQTGSQSSIFFPSALVKFYIRENEEFLSFLKVEV